MNLAVLLVGLISLVIGLGIGCWISRRRQARHAASSTQESIATLRTQLERAHRMEALGILCGSIMHNLNNLLSVVIGQARLARDMMNPDSPSWHSLTRVIQAGETAAELSREIDSFQREVDHDRHPLRLQSVVRATVKMLRDILPDTVQIETELDPACGPVLASAPQVQQILMSLCSNAHQAMYRRRGRIMINLEAREIHETTKAIPHDLAPGNYVTLTVADNGRGMDPGTLQQVFTPYFSARSPHHGAGLGLTMISRLLTANESVTVPTSLPGHGTRFVIYFPLIAREHGAKRVSLAGKDPPAGHLASPVDRSAANYQAPAAISLAPAMLSRSTDSLHVLLLEDNDMVADLVRTCLMRAGMKVTVFEDGARAAATFIADPGAFDLLLTDQFLRGLDGREVVAEIKKTRPRMPVVLMSGHPEGILAEEVERLGINATLAKPFTPAQLISAVRSALRSELRVDAERA